VKKIRSGINGPDEAVAKGKRGSSQDSCPKIFVLQI
jgi:hypothetical protein